MRRQSYVEAMRICLGEESVEEEGSAAGLRLVKLVHEIVRCLLVLLSAPLTGASLRDAPVKCACILRLVKLLRQAASGICTSSSGCVLVAQLPGVPSYHAGL